MIPMILLYAVALTIFIVPSIFITKWANAYITRNLTARLEAIQVIVNEKRVPESWRAPFAQKATALQLKNGSQEQLTRIEKKVKQKCLRNLENLIKYCDHFQMTDSMATQKLLLDGLRREHARWAEMDWRDVLEREPDSEESTQGKPLGI